MDPFILEKKEARMLAIWETLCQHPDVCILLYNLLNQCNIKLGGWESESMGRRNRAFFEGGSH